MDNYTNQHTNHTSSINTITSIKHRKAITAITIITTIITTFIAVICIFLAITNETTTGICTINQCVFSDFHNNNFSIRFISEAKLISFNTNTISHYPCVTNVSVECYSKSKVVSFDPQTNVYAIIAAMFSSVSTIGVATTIALRYVFTDYSFIDTPPLDELDMLEDVIEVKSTHKPTHKP
jgi:hypothetical protein